MKFFKAIASIGMLYLSVGADAAKRGEDKEADALYDIQTGMAGLQNVAKDPAMLAQLMQDMQDPELMSYFTSLTTKRVLLQQDPELMMEAKRMQESPEFKKQMKKLEGTKGFKDSMKKSKEALKDPSTAARMEAQMEHMLTKGQEQLKNNAKGQMQEAMQAMNNPDVLAAAAKYMADPDFQKNMAKMAEDPAFKNYIAGMQDMMKDPAAKARMEKMSEQLKAAM
eukprot:CAMPEP_0178693778 /NCGR_PEP_ID=MMETSP0699-20121125/7890_1 /TAXON_ID=265572 /ORGANISM="Extubocellulus spinifer, Strain CCMP396" /LENGTH=223 /DNA_ID=CAMNT_0020339205 /DNA_START=20 /DNA_END=692 /DNA_ORIENTATION=+